MEKPRGKLGLLFPLPSSRAQCGTWSSSTSPAPGKVPIKALQGILDWEDFGNPSRAESLTIPGTGAGSMSHTQPCCSSGSSFLTISQIIVSRMAHVESCGRAGALEWGQFLWNQPSQHLDLSTSHIPSTWDAPGTLCPPSLSQIHVARISFTSSKR